MAQAWWLKLVSLQQGGACPRLLPPHEMTGGAPQGRRRPCRWHPPPRSQGWWSPAAPGAPRSRWWRPGRV